MTAPRCRMALLALALLGGCVDPPLVVQGTVVRLDVASNTVSLRDELAPNRELAIGLEGAEIGGQPESGDLVRVAYRDQAGRLVALRLMNLTRQEELAKAGRRK